MISSSSENVTKLKILEDEIKIIEDTNLRFKEENETLKTNINKLNNTISNLKNTILSQKNEIEQFNLDTEEMKFLKMNLDYSYKCRRSFFNSKGFLVGTSEYRNCVMNKGRKD